ncbi:hypothetical protein P3X46_005750 [Hevea brasiliensis]|uniref:Uncharacterized protein n=1 Tax=Hevea brasiliensis TaxID=3981 RepID=A0ABQ9N3A7_HEVBR|nr:uncharacterized protein LOC131178780 [Hevea brasiliensis]KAJ9186223.1 hypothetical protein P3X46_005750 [Hevea brasiliensis]
MEVICNRCVDGGGVLVDEIQSNLSKFGHLGDVQETDASDGDCTSGAEGFQELEPFGHEPVKNSLEKAVALPSEDDEPETALRLLFSGEPIRPALPLVSAMKGSREKLGTSPRKLSVTWAPDVYDPIPNSVSHSVTSKQRKSRKDKGKNSNNNHKKNGKKGQKGNSKGGGGKDKKQLRKTGGRSDKCYKTLNTCDAPDLDEFDVGSPDYCGSSFLKKSPTTFHYPVAEAL